MDEARKSSRCGNSNSCVYVKPRKLSPNGTTVLIGVGESPINCDAASAPVFTKDEWDAFIAGVKAGEFDWDVITKTTGSTSTQGGYVDPNDADTVRRADSPRTYEGEPKFIPRANTPLPTDMPSVNQPEPTADEILREIDALRHQIEGINDEPVGHLAAAVRVERQFGGEPATLDLVALAEITTRNQTVYEMYERSVRQLGGELQEIARRISSLETTREDQRKTFATLSGTLLSEDAGCTDPDCGCS